MNNQIILKLKSKIKEVITSGVSNMETQRNVLKEELQYYVLNFIYHHTKYSNWIMYGGSALRICHKLNRMSVDLDFEIDGKCDDGFIEKLKSEVELHFINVYGVDSNFLTIKKNNNRGLRLNFHVGNELGLGYSSDLIHVKIDLNCFTAPKTTIERIPINYDQFSFVIKTYNMSNLMSSKIAAIFLRGERGVGKDIFNEKGRDIYDLLWYMGKRIIPDIDYLKAKNVDVSDIRNLFDKLTIQMNKVNDTNLSNDLTPLFVDQNEIKNWLKNWRESYLMLEKDYKIYSIKEIKYVEIFKDFQTDNFSFRYWYEIEDGKSVDVTYKISDYWIKFKDGDISTRINDKVIDLITERDHQIKKAISSKVKQYATLFYEKTEDYFKKTKGVIIGDSIKTKVVRMTADNLNRSEQILLTPSALLSCNLEDLLK